MIRRVEVVSVEPGPTSEHVTCRAVTSDGEPRLALEVLRLAEGSECGPLPVGTQLLLDIAVSVVRIEEVAR
jgi:hypothetical protein